MEQTSDLTGSVWTNSVTFLRGSSCSGGLIRRNSEYHHEDILGAFPVITNSSGTTLSSNLYDTYGVLRFSSGTAATQFRSSAGYNEAEGLLADCWIQAERDLQISPQQCGQKQKPKPNDGFKKCCKKCDHDFNQKRPDCDKYYAECMKEKRGSRTCQEEKNNCIRNLQSKQGGCKARCRADFGFNDWCS